jgi:hypothetical protein
MCWALDARRSSAHTQKKNTEAHLHVFLRAKIRSWQQREVHRDTTRSLDMYTGAHLHVSGSLDVYFLCAGGTHAAVLCCAVRCARLAGAHTCAACTPPPSDRIRGQKALTAQRRPGGVCLCLIDDPPAALAARAAECHCHAAAGSSCRRAWSWLATLSRVSTNENTS